MSDCCHVFDSRSICVNCGWTSTYCELQQCKQQLAEARAEIATLRTAQWYWDDRDLERAVPADVLGDYDDLGDIFEVRPIHELPVVWVLIRDDGPHVFTTSAEAEAAKAGGGE